MSNASSARLHHVVFFAEEADKGRLTSKSHCKAQGVEERILRGVDWGD
jgi:hypothetical protein